MIAGTSDQCVVNHIVQSIVASRCRSRGVVSSGSRADIDARTVISTLVELLHLRPGGPGDTDRSRLRALVSIAAHGEPSLALPDAVNVINEVLGCSLGSAAVDTIRSRVRRAEGLSAASNFGDCALVLQDAPRPNAGVVRYKHCHTQ